MSRVPRQQSDRIGVHKCRWKYHSAFVDDLKRINPDKKAWEAIKGTMQAAADGTARDVKWEFPCASSSGTIGELKIDLEDEVRFLDECNEEVIEPAVIHYRVYFNEPQLCPQELWAMAIGVKSLHPTVVCTPQQTDIENAALRASQSGPTGLDLRYFNM